tara:strand:- start:712 stop:816 length:105 start_codon:yes stop_codon:yes gene_type:complete
VLLLKITPRLRIFKKKSPAQKPGLFYVLEKELYY